MHICKVFCLIVDHSNKFQESAMYNLVYQLQCSSIKFCSYNFVLNEEPNSNDTMHVANTVHLTTMEAQRFSMAAIQSSCRKADLLETRNNDTITGKVRADGSILCPGKEWRLYTRQFMWQVDQCGQAVSECVSECVSEMKSFVISQLPFSEF